MEETKNKETEEIKTEAVTEEAVTEEAVTEEAVTEEAEKKASAKEEKKSAKAEKEISTLKEELKQANDKYMRLAAEYDNYRKRTVKEKSDAYSDAYSDAVKNILPIIDTLDKALEFTPDDEGIKAIVKQTADIFAKMGVTEIESDGKEFDPNLHNAIMHEEDSEKGENVITQTFQKGYMLGEKVIRHAMVKVAN